MALSDTSDSGHEDKEPVKKKSKKDILEKDENKNDLKGDKPKDLMYQLGKLRYINVSEWKGRKMVNIREYYNDDKGELKPGKKGISLSLDQWARLKEHMEDIDAQLN